MWNPALDVLGYKFEIHAAEKPMRDNVLADVDLDILVACLDQRHSLVLLRGLNLQPGDWVEHVAGVPTALNRGFSAPVMKADVTDWDPALRLCFVGEGITAQVIKENVKALLQLFEHFGLDGSSNCGD